MSSLLDRVSAIEDRMVVESRLIQYCRAVDRLDVELLKDVYFEDATDDHGHFVGNAHAFAEDLVPLMRRLFLSTQHRLSNVCISLAGDDAAAESYYDAYHQVPGGSYESLAEFFGEHYADAQRTAGRVDQAHEFVTGGRYIDQFKRRNGEWRIFERRITNEWGQIQPITTQRAGGILASLVRMRGYRDKADPSYSLAVDRKPIEDS